MLGGVYRIFELPQPPDYVFLVELDWCPPSRHIKDLTVSLTQMAKIIEIKIVPMKILPHLTLREILILLNFLYVDYTSRLYSMQ